MNSLLKKIPGLFGYKIVSGQEYDKLIYTAKYKSQTRSEHAVSATSLKKLLLSDSPSPTIVDVGAYVGQTVNDYLDMFPEANIFAFEPTPISYTQLQKKFHTNKQVKCFNIAVSDTNGEIPFHINEFSPTNSSLPTDNDADKYWGDELLNTVEQTTVYSKTLDEVCSAEGLDKIDLLKLDVQGTELQLLNGASKMLDEGKISIIYLEMLFVPTYKGQSAYFEIGEFLSKKGFDVYGIFNLTYDKQLKQADILFYRG